MNTKQPEALRLANILRGIDARSRFANEKLSAASAALENQHARITELESQLAQRFDAADMATAAAQGFRDGVAPVSAGSEPVAAEESRLYGDAKLAHDQCRAVVHLAHMLAEVYQANALILAAGQGPVEIIGEASAEVMEILGDIINSTDAMDEDDLWLDPIYDAAQARWPAERAAAPGPADGESNELC